MEAMCPVKVSLEIATPHGAMDDEHFGDQGSLVVHVMMGETSRPSGPSLEDFLSENVCAYRAWTKTHDKVFPKAEKILDLSFLQGEQPHCSVP